ncbi:MAG: alpha/beta hydrolase fold domain-containing protein, partial [Actinomycetota bacterium]
LRRDVTFSTRVDHAAWDDASATWSIDVSPAGHDETNGAGETIRCRWYVMATGCLSAPKDPDIEGATTFGGEVYVTGRWPHEGVDFSGKRVGVIGTGSSAIQSIPHIAAEADELVIFQRTPNFSIPAHNGPPRPDKRARIDGRVDEYRHEARYSSAGVPRDIPAEGALTVDEGERQRRYEKAWDEGTIFSLMGSFNDLLLDPDANDTAAEFVRGKIREIVDDPTTAEALCPTTYPIGTKRLCLDTDYYDTFNRDHVSLVDLRSEPIERITETGVETATRSFEFDAVVFATGFDAMTGAIVAVDIEGRDGLTLRDSWADGPHTYLGLMSVGFPNLFMITGPQSPSVLSNMAVSIEQHVDLVCDTIEALRAAGHDAIEPTTTAQDGWVQHTLDFADITLFPRANSWYMGANVPGKARVVLPYVGGVDRYRRACEEMVERDYLGFRRWAAGADPSAGDGTVNDGIIRAVAPDVLVMLEMMAELGLPPIETLPVDAAREFMDASAAMRPPGPEVAEVVDGTYPGAEGELAYRLYRPEGDGPLPIVVYFHGGGWVLGHTESDDPFCRDLCVQTGAIVVSFDYRHAPEHRFPAAPDDALAAVRWVADNAASLGGDGRLAVAGWSAGANLAAVVAQQLRDAGDGPAIEAQLLVTPVTDDMGDRPSYTDNADGYILTAGLMRWFWDHYADRSDRTDVRAAPLRHPDLSGLPTAIIVTSEFDPLRDEGHAYADALSAAGVEVTHLRAEGQTHTSLHAVNALITPGPIRARAFAALKDRLGVSIPA